MRLLAGALLVLALVAAASASTVVPIYSKGSLGKGAFGKQSCGAPIGRVACRIDPAGYVTSVFYSHFSAATGLPQAPLHTPYLRAVAGTTTSWFTQNWCGAFNFIGACEGTSGSGTTDLPAAGTQVGFTTKLIEFGGATAAPVVPAATGTLNVRQPVLNKMTICWGKKGIIGITFGARSYNTFWGQATATSTPVPMWSAPQALADDTCGTTTGCLATTTYNAPEGKAIGGFDWKCKANQDWVGFKQTGTYGTGGAGKNKYRLKDIYKVCLTDVTPYPNARFIPCDANPNVCTAVAPALTCPPTSDFWRHQCQCNNGFKK